jgi:putative holliday junction resolvase
MGRILALDYGGKRTGVAVTDPLKMFGQALTTVNTNELKPFLENYFKEEAVEKVIIGLPFSLDGTATHNTDPVLKFVGFFKKAFPLIPIETVDETFTSKLAMQVLVNNGTKQKQRREKGLIDKTAAALILQEYLGNL